ncbi:MAG: sulfatase-like hydrolase/transferase, partial [Desulfobacteraceae bacterium]|nr:sulfatase-like hydrolase/transferase [Desulfobacteraceae bacterium]
LASQGVLFENAFVTTSLCSPSRASFLTGQYAHTHGVQNNLTPWSDANVTFLEHLKGAGYSTGFIGKWHMPGKLPKLKGVDTFTTFTVREGQGQYWDCPLIVDGVETTPNKRYITEELTDRALTYIGQQHASPFCLYVSFKAAHHDWQPPDEMEHLYADDPSPFADEADTWVTMTNGGIWAGTVGPLERHYKNYCRVITSVDKQIGRILNTLDELGLADDTIVVYAGDNGYLWGEHRLIDKRWAYEESIRIPFIVRAPGLVSDPGRRADQMVLNIDLAPTLLEAAGLPVPATMHGKSILPILKSEDSPGREVWLYEYFTDFPYNTPELRAVRTESFIYIEYEGGRPPELYDVKTDPKQKQNLVTAIQGKKLENELQAIMSVLLEKGRI